MITLKKFLDASKHYITEGAEYGWNCFGKNARFLSCGAKKPLPGQFHPPNASIVYDVKTNVVYNCELWLNKIYEERHGKDVGPWRWENPEFKAKHDAECKKRGFLPHRATDSIDFVEASEKDILRLITKYIK